jgi:hypothetical protein
MRAAVVGAAALLTMMGLTGCGLLREAAERDSYDFGADTVASIKAVVGLRTVTGVSTSSSVENGVSVQEKKYTYRSDTARADLTAYADYLENEAGYLLVRSEDFALPSGWVQLAADSAEEGLVLLVELSWEPVDRYTVFIQKGKGSVDVYLPRS